MNEKMNEINIALNKMILPEERDGGLSAYGWPTDFTGRPTRRSIGAVTGWRSSTM